MDLPDLPIKTHHRQILAPSKGMTRTSYLAEKKKTAGDFQSFMAAGWPEQVA